MIALFFEVLPRPGQEATYFEIAARLKPAVEASGGLLFLDRSRSSVRPEWFLSHQFWRDEAAMTSWRTHPAHHRAQTCGRTDVLADYRLRVGYVTAQSCAGQGVVCEPWERVAAYNDPTHVAERFMVSVVASAPLPDLGGEAFASVTHDALHVQVIEVADERAGLAVLEMAAVHAATRHARLCLVSRDYGLSDRREAPQYFEPVVSLA